MSASRLPERPCPLLFVAPPLRFSGVSLGCLRAAEAMARRGIDALVLTSDRGALRVAETGAATVHELPWLHYPVLTHVAAALLRRRLRRTGVRVVHAHGAAQIALGARFARALGVPLLATIYHFARGAAAPPWIDWRRVAALTTFSDALKQDVINCRGAPRALVRVVCAGVAAGEAPPPVLMGRDRVPVIGTLVEHEKPRSAHVLIDAVPQVLAREPEAQFLIGVDDLTPQHALRSAIAAKGLCAQVTITGVREVRRLLEVMDLCVLPAVEEGPCQPLLEALAAARPVIAGASGSAYSVVQDEVSGRLFPRDDARALADTILALLADPAAARALGEAGRAQVLATCSLERTGADLEELYRELGVALTPRPAAAKANGGARGSGRR